jgi:hypothetical protein
MIKKTRETFREEPKQKKTNIFVLCYNQYIHIQILGKIMLNFEAIIRSPLNNNNI